VLFSVLHLDGWLCCNTCCIGTSNNDAI